MLSDDLAILGRNKEIFSIDFDSCKNVISKKILGSRILIVGGSGSIGSVVVSEILSKKPKTLHVIDINENALVELVRDLRIRFHPISCDFRIFCLDVGAIEFRAFMVDAPEYDYILNLSALKHVRSENDPYTLMRMLQVNIVNNKTLIEFAKRKNTKSFFSVSSDKATDPCNVMGATKRVMEILIADERYGVTATSARFANVAFSRGSLLDGFKKRFEKRQPLFGPSDIQRYFITQKEAGRLCILSAFLGTHGDIFFPNVPEEVTLQNFQKIARRFLAQKGYNAVFCKTENEAKNFSFGQNNKNKNWPCYFSKSVTTGEKDKEIFFTQADHVSFNNFVEIGIIKQNVSSELKKIDYFLENIMQMRSQESWSKEKIIADLQKVVSNFVHKELNINLSERN